MMACGLARQALAQTPRPADLATATIEDLMKITVTTATRTPEGVANAPARVQVVTAAQIERRGYRSLLDVLKDLADFKVDLASDFDYPTELTVDGTRGASRVVVLLDGIRVSSPTNEPLPIMANYPVHNARQVEIVYGPASALYGADAFSAVINIISKDVTESPGLAVASSVGQFGLYNQTASYGIRLGANATLMLDGQFLYDRQPDLSRSYPSLFGGLVGQHTGTFDSIYGPITSAQPVSPDYNIPLSAHSLHATLRAGGLQLSLFENRSRISTSLPQTPENTVYNDVAFNANSLVVAAATYTRAIGRATSTSTVTLSRHELDPQSGYWNVFNNFVRGYKYAYGSSWKAEEQVSWKPTSAITMTTGGSFEHFYSIPQGADLNAPITSQDVPGTILGTNIPDDFVKLRYANIGAYAQMQYAMTPRLALTLGGRADENTRYGATFNPRVGLVAQATTRTTLKFLYGTAFLAPSPWQEYTHWGSFVSADGGATYTSPYWHLPNSNLRPQHKETVEGTVLQTLRADLSVSASLFYSRITDLVLIADPDLSYAGFFHGWPVAYIDFPVNEGEETTYGSTLGLDFLHSFDADRQIAARLGLSFVDGRSWTTDAKDAPLPVGGLSPVQLRLSADMDWDRWSIAPRLAVVGTQRTMATEDTQGSVARRTLPGYATVDLTVRRHLRKSVDAFLMVENAFDRRYVNLNIHAYINPEEFIGSPQNPRRVSVGFSLRVR